MKKIILLALFLVAASGISAQSQHAEATKYGIRYIDGLRAVKLNNVNILAELPDDKSTYDIVGLVYIKKGSGISKKKALKKALKKTQKIAGKWGGNAIVIGSTQKKGSAFWGRAKQTIQAEVIYLHF